LSDKEIKLSVPTNDTVDDNELLNHEDTFRLKLKQCIIRVQNENLNVCEDFRASDVFVRHSKSIKVYKLSDYCFFYLMILNLKIFLIPKIFN
jgi:hypothetical protein